MLNYKKVRSFWERVGSVMEPSSVHDIPVGGFIYTGYIFVVSLTLLFLVGFEIVSVAQGEQTPDIPLEGRYTGV